MGRYQEGSYRAFARFVWAFLRPFDLLADFALSKACTTFVATDSGVCFFLIVGHEMVLHEMESVTVPVSVPDHRRIAAEYDASLSYSASCYQHTEHVRIFAMIMAESELCEVERQIFRAYLMGKLPTMPRFSNAQNDSIELV